jgi:hypothetical protein
LMVNRGQNRGISSPNEVSVEMADEAQVRPRASGNTVTVADH